MAIYLTSDWHFCHDQPFIYEPRGFKNIDEMNEAIIAKHNSIVSPEDDVIVLGDLMLNDTEKGIECVNRLNGNLHIVYGNHDTPKRIQEYINLKLDLGYYREFNAASKFLIKPFPGSFRVFTAEHFDPKNIDYIDIKFNEALLRDLYKIYFSIYNS